MGFFDFLDPNKRKISDAQERAERAQASAARMNQQVNRLDNAHRAANRAVDASGSDYDPLPYEVTNPRDAGVLERRRVEDALDHIGVQDRLDAVSSQLNMPAAKKARSEAEALKRLAELKNQLR